MPATQPPPALGSPCACRCAGVYDEDEAADEPWLAEAPFFTLYPVWWCSVCGPSHAAPPLPPEARCDVG